MGKVIGIDLGTTNSCVAVRPRASAGPGLRSLLHAECRGGKEYPLRVKQFAGLRRT
jgi:hypothetical protein